MTRRQMGILAVVVSLAGAGGLLILRSRRASARRAAFDNQGVPESARALVAKVARAAWTVTDADVAAAKSAGVSEDEIFELTVCAALGQATTAVR